MQRVKRLAGSEIADEVDCVATRIQDPVRMGYALQELRQVVVESAGAEDRLLEPVPANEIVDLEPLLN